MFITSIHAENFKCYKKPIDISIKKFNIIIGKNSAGKSAFLTLLPLIIFNISKDAKDEFFLNPYNIDLDSDYTDIVHGHSQMTPLTLGATFQKNLNKITFRTKLVYFIEIDRILPTDFSLTVDDEIIYEISLETNLAINKKVAFYNNKSSTLTSRVKFKGLLPLKTESKEANTYISLMRKFDFNLSYLGPFRDIVKRTYTKRKLNDFEIGYKGENAPFLFQNLSKNHEISDSVKKWMMENLNGKFYEIKDFEKAFAVECNNGITSTNLIDEGMGLTQIFPSIINRKYRDLFKKNGIEIIEQPELHMHPAAAGAISDLYIEAANLDGNSIFIETHSKEILLRARRRVAEGKFNNDDFNILFVDNNDTLNPIKEISVNKKGGVSYWPSGIFEETIEEVIALSEAISE